MLSRTSLGSERIVAIAVRVVDISRLPSLRRICSGSSQPKLRQGLDLKGCRTHSSKYCLQPPAWVQAPHGLTYRTCRRHLIMASRHLGRDSAVSCPLRLTYVDPQVLCPGQSESPQCPDRASRSLRQCRSSRSSRLVRCYDRFRKIRLNRAPGLPGLASRSTCPVSYDQGIVVRLLQG